MHAEFERNSFSLLCKRANEAEQAGDQEVLETVFRNMQELLENEDSRHERKHRIFQKMLERSGMEHPFTSVRHRRVPDSISGTDTGTSLITCAMNRTENLLECLPTWLAHDEINEIIIIDWTSDEPVRESLLHHNFDDPRIRVVRALDEPRWVLSFAFNLGFRLARYDKIIKTDADIQLKEHYFRNNEPNDGVFIAGNWETATPGQEHTNGFFNLKTAHLSAINGFNEYIITYGWDDDDIYSRLNGIGSKRVLVDQSSIHHLIHDDSSRIETTSSTQSALEELRQKPLFHIRRNRFVATVAPQWNIDRHMTPFEILIDNGTDMTVRRVIQDTPHYLADTIHEDSEYFAALEVISWKVGPQAYHVPRGRFLEILNSRTLDSITTDTMIEAGRGPMDTAWVPKPQSHINVKPRLFVDTQHGLGNRLRAAASAATIAAATGRELVLVWQADSHCNCQFQDLFDYDGAVLQESFFSQAADQGCATYNYMTVEPGADKDAPLDLSWSGDIYARSAFVLNASQSNWEDENRFLRNLRPVEEVLALVASVRTPNDVSAHVRMVGGTDYEHIPYEATDNWTKADHMQTDFWRRKSHFRHFIKRLEILVSEGHVERIFLAADKPETYAEFNSCFGNRVAMLERDVYDRSCEQLRYALADALLLGSSPLLLGSSWSSFSELALRLAPSPIQLEMSGEDF